MRIGTRALIILVPVAVLPLVGAGWSAFNVSRRALEDRTRASQVAAARSLAVRARGGVVLAVEFSLARLLPLVAESRLGARGGAAVVDRAGLVVLSSNRGEVASRASRAGSPLVQAALAGNLGALAFEGADRIRRLGASAEVPDLGWVVAVDEPAEDALAESRVLARRTL